MFEMNPDGPSSSPSPDISFEMPAHEMCVERQAVLRRLDGQSEYMTFVIDFMPDKIHINGRKFIYEGVANGRGFYREMPRENNLKELGIDTDCTACIAEAVLPVGTLIAGHTCQRSEIPLITGPEIYDTHGSLGSMAAALRYAEDLVGGDSFGEHYDPTMEGLDKAHGLHTTASPCDNMPCSRCSEVLDLVSEMIENPPGLSGIQSPLGHIGNQYVDAGWVEALTRVKAHLVTGGSGTRETL